MDDSSQQPAPVKSPKKTKASATQAQSGNQPPIMNSVEAPKKKKKKLIIGIVSGVIALALLVTALLLYFLWWQHPQKMVNDAMMGAARMTKARVNGKVTMKIANQAKLELDIASNAADSKTKADINAKITVGQLSRDFKAKLSMVTDDKMNVYLKFEDFKELVKGIVDTVYDMQLRSQGAYGLIDRAEAEVQKRRMLAEMEPKLQQIEGKWLKVSPETMVAEGSHSATNKCVEELSVMLRDDKQAREEAIDVYKKHSFLMVDTDAKVEPRNGAPGFEIDLSPNGESARRAKEFAMALKDTKIGKKMTECYGENTFNSSSSSTSRGSGKVALRVWVDSWSHQLRALSLKADDAMQDMHFDLTMDIEGDKSDAIDVPTDAADFKKTFEEVFGQSLPLGDGDTEFDFEGESI